MEQKKKETGRAEDSLRYVMLAVLFAMVLFLPWYSLKDAGVQPAAGKAKTDTGKTKTGKAKTGKTKTGKTKTDVGKTDGGQKAEQTENKGTIVIDPGHGACRLRKGTIF